MTLLTILPMVVLSFFPEFLKPLDADGIAFQPQFVAIFVGFVVITTTFPAWIHTEYIRDFSPIRKWVFFTVFATIAGVVLGEAANPVMLAPYGIFMLVYAYLYRKLPWWKIAASGYFGGVLIENVINRGAVKIQTIMWLAFVIYPYFWTKILENWRELDIKQILRDMKWFFIPVAIMELLAIPIFKLDNMLIAQLIILPATLGVFSTIKLWQTIKKYKTGELTAVKGMVPWKKSDLTPLIIFAVVVIIFMVVVSSLVSGKFA